MHIVQRIFGLILVCAALIGSTACGNFAAQPPMPVVGAAAPDFVLPTLQGDNVRLSELKPRVVIVNFWASWCPPCVEETPRLVGWHQRYRTHGLAVVGVDTLYQDSRDAVVKFAEEHHVDYPMLVDQAGDVSRQWQARQLPRSYIIDQQGVVRFVRIGELTERDFETQVLPLLQPTS